MLYFVYFLLISLLLYFNSLSLIKQKKSFNKKKDFKFDIHINAMNMYELVDLYNKTDNKKLKIRINERLKYYKHYLNKQICQNLKDI
jgi:hypothetical protein